MIWLPLTSAKMAKPSEHDTGSLLAMLGRKKTSWAIKIADHDDNGDRHSLIWCDEPSISGIDSDGASMSACKDFGLDDSAVPGWTVPLAVQANPESLVPVSEIALQNTRGMIMVGPRGVHISAYDRHAKNSMRFVNIATWGVDVDVHRDISAHQYQFGAYFREWKVIASFDQDPVVVRDFK